MGRNSAIALLLAVLLGVAAVAEASLYESNPAILRFREYLRIRTDQPKPDYLSAEKFLLAQAKDIGLEARSLTYEAGKPVVLMTWAGSDPALPSILLNSHTDVVPAERQFWTHDPFGAEMDSEGRIFARGSQDMKCVGMQYLEAIRLLKRDGFTPKRTVHVIFVPDEEIGGKAGMHAFVESDLFKTLNIGLELDEGWASPTEVFPVFYAERTAWWFVIKAQGEPGHGSKLYDGSAMGRLQGAMARVFAFREKEHNKMKAGAAPGEVVSINLAYLRGGVPQEPSSPFAEAQFVMNLQPATAEAGFDMRIPYTTPLPEVERMMAEEWAPRALNLSFEFKGKSTIKMRADGTPGVTSTDPEANPWWGVMKRSLERQGLPFSLEIFPAATDCSFLRAKDVPAFGFSPMRRTPKLLHEHNEFLSADVFLEGAAIHRELIADLAGEGSPGVEAAAGESRDEL